MIRHFRFHGRGGAGVKLGSRIVSRAAFLSGLNVQDSPLYGAERRGAPVVAFARFSDGPIRERGYISAPDAVVVMDASLLDRPEAAVLDGVDAGTVLLVNTPAGGDTLRRQYSIPGRVVAMDVSSVALELLQEHWLSVPVAGFVVRAVDLCGWEVLARALALELRAVGVEEDRLPQNLAAARRSFDAAPVVGFCARAAVEPAVRAVPAFEVPRLPARISAPSITAGATSVLRRTGSWRVFRPVIDLDRCTRCSICFALCPEGAIALDTSGTPFVDYDHCKGCLVCVEECPPEAITPIREAAA